MQALVSANRYLACGECITRKDWEMNFTPDISGKKYNKHILTERKKEVKLFALGLDLFFKERIMLLD